MFNIVKKIFGSSQERKCQKYFKIVRQINAFEEGLQKLSNDQIKEKSAILKSRVIKGESLDSVLIEAYAIVKNVCRRLTGTEIYISGFIQKWNMVPYDVQLVGALAMHYGSIAEMQTGEGKTLTATLPLYLNALTKKPVHLVTVNDYLAKRDCEWSRPIFDFLGISTASLTNDVPPHRRKAIYEADIVYGTASEFGFDYLRDNSMASSKEEQCQRGYFFSIIDEVDSILIDESRTPLIISGPSSISRQMYDLLKGPVYEMVKIQRDECNRLASDARRTLEKLGLITESETTPKLTKEEQEEKMRALKELWLVSKGTPTNKILKRIKENPDLRADLENLETYYWGEQNKEERKDDLSKLLIIIDERSQDYELTDKGIKEWKGDESTFTMLDLGDEYAKIDENTNLSDQEKMAKKVAIREEDSSRKEKAHNVRQLFRAHLLMEKDVDYIIQDGKIVIIDENTGRPQPGRRFSDGLHQSIEAKEGVAIQKETQTYASITLQNYFRLYEKLAGMTGTAITEASEFKDIYQIDVLQIPTHKKCIRVDFNDEIYMTEREKYNAILQEILRVHKEGRPILLGTESVEASEKISRILKSHNLEHTVLNAKNHEKEAEIISLAGSPHAITVATNMAGRGTDIKLGQGVAEKGGLHVIGTCRHQSRRIDRQLRGRCSRQGDPGSSKFYVSFEDSLMRLFSSPKLTTLLQRFRPPEGEPISAKMLNRSIETAQKRVEGRNFSMRKHTLEYDDVMNKHRQEVYAFRHDIINSENPLPICYDILKNFNATLCDKFFINRHQESGWRAEEYRKTLMAHFPITLEESAFSDNYLTLEEIETISDQKIIEAFKRKLKGEAVIIGSMQKINGQKIAPKPVLFDVLRSILIKCIDSHWQKHLLGIDHLKTEVSMRTIAQKDPLLEFKHEAFELFDTFSRDVKEKISHLLFAFTMMIPEDIEVQKLLSQLQIMGPPSDIQKGLETIEI